MSSTPHESATLLLRLYELRRESTMREARNWFALEFNPSNFEELVQAVMGPHSGHYRMVTSYWDMAASFVLNGAIDEQMFNDANGEQVGVFAKVEPYLTDYRARVGNPKYLSQLEQIVLRRPGAKEQLAAMREWFRNRAAATTK
jgi:hypothetical protein